MDGSWSFDAVGAVDAMDTKASRYPSHHEVRNNSTAQQAFSASNKKT